MPQGFLGAGAHVSEVLTDLAIAYAQKRDDFIARKIFPVAGVKVEEGKFPVWDKSEAFRLQMQPYDGRSAYPLGSLSVSMSSYQLDMFALAELITARDRALWMGQIDIEQARVQHMTEQFMLRSEYEVLSKLFTAASWTTQITGVASGAGASQINQWNGSGSLPLEDIEEMKRDFRILNGLEPNTLVVGSKVHSTLRNHSELVGRIQYSQKGIITEDLLKEFFGVDKYLVARASYNTAAAGATASMAAFNETSAWLGYVSANASIIEPSAGYLLVHSELDEASKEGVPVLFDIPVNEPVEASKLGCQASLLAKVCAADLGVHITTAVAA